MSVDNPYLSTFIHIPCGKVCICILCMNLYFYKIVDKSPIFYSYPHNFSVKNGVWILDEFQALNGRCGSGLRRSEWQA